MKTIVCFLILALHVVSSFAPLVRPTVAPAPLSSWGSPLFSSQEGETDQPLRKRDRLMKAVKKVKGKVFSPDNDEFETTTPKGRRKKLDDKKYENIEDLEEKAYQILLDLDMIQEHS